MKGQLIHVLGEGIEELYWTDELDKKGKKTFAEKVGEWWKEWESEQAQYNIEEEDFEEWMHRTHSLITIERVFVEEAYV